ncbi:hypothetical protein KKH05_00315 [Patescibacteria group bacterium]|nr:hypothetical protein [Patescibacteria group bacterium]
MNPTENFLHSSHEDKDELLSQRIEFIKQQDPSLRTLTEVGRGDSYTAYSCEYEEANISPTVLKVNRLAEGISDVEIKAWSDLSGTAGLPRVLRTYRDGLVPIAMLMEKIEGEHLEDWLSSHGEDVLSIIEQISELINAFHRRGFFMPKDWGKTENWLVDNSGQPHLLDLGEVGILNEDEEARGFQVRRDFGNLYSLIDPFTANMGKRERRTLEGMMLRDLRRPQ